MYVGWVLNWNLDISINIGFGIKYDQTGMTLGNINLIPNAYQGHEVIQALHQCMYSKEQGLEDYWLQTMALLISILIIYFILTKNQHWTLRLGLGCYESFRRKLNTNIILVCSKVNTNPILIYTCVILAKNWSLTLTRIGQYKFLKTTQILRLGSYVQWSILDQHWSLVSI